MGGGGKRYWSFVIFVKPTVFELFKIEILNCRHFAKCIKIKPWFMVQVTHNIHFNKSGFNNVILQHSKLVYKKHRQKKRLFKFIGYLDFILIP